MLAAGLHWRLESDGSCFRFKKKMKIKKKNGSLGTENIQSKKGRYFRILNVD
jgi:hypothetical protein